MKKLRKVLSAVLLICMLLSLLPAQVFAADEIYYELDTNELDVGETYLVVRSYVSMWSGNKDLAYTGHGSADNKPMAVSINNGKIAYVSGMENAEWTLEDYAGQYTYNNQYSLVHNYQNDGTTTKRYLDIRNGVTFSATQAPLSISGSGTDNAYYVYYQSSESKYMLLALLDNYTTLNEGKNSTYQLRFYKKVGGTTANEYTVSFDGNGHTGGTVPAAETVTAGTKYYAPAAGTLVKNGYTFEGWNTAADGSGTHYDPKDEVALKGDLVLYAQWKAIPTYPVTVNVTLNDTGTAISAVAREEVTMHLCLAGSDALQELTATGATGVYTVNVPGGTYALMFRKADGSLTDSKVVIEVTDGGTETNLRYYSVAYEIGAGAQSDEIPIGIYPAGTQVAVTDVIPTLEGYDFVGWKDMKDANAAIVTAGALVTTNLQKKTTLTAQWQEKEPEIEFIETSYVVQYLLKGTYQVLQDETIVESANLLVPVRAEDAAMGMENFDYTYVGALINGEFVPKEQNPELELSADVSKNVLPLIFLPNPDLHLHKTATLEDNGTYTIQLEMFTHSNPVTTITEQNMPLDIVLVLDQSGSMYFGGVNDDLAQAVAHFVDLIADHGRTNETDHRLAVVGYASGDDTGYSGNGPIAGGLDKDNGVTVKGERYKYFTNTGVFDSNGDFHAYGITGFTYEKAEMDLASKEPYYVWSEDYHDYLLLTYHENYRHLITEEEAYTRQLAGEQIYGSVGGNFIAVKRDNTGMWMYGDNWNHLYSSTEFFTWHTEVWTHRYGMEPREIHAKKINGVYTPTDGHDNIVYVRKETMGNDYSTDLYKDALMPVTMGAQGSGWVDPSFDKIVENLGANGATRVSYGMQMAQNVFQSNPVTKQDEEDGRQRVVIVFTDGKPGDSITFNEMESNAALSISEVLQREYGAQIYTIGLYGETSYDGADADVARTKKDQKDFLLGLSSLYPSAKQLDDVWQKVTYEYATKTFTLSEGGYYYVEVNDKHYPLFLSEKKDHLGNSVFRYYWCYKDDAGNTVTALSYRTDAIPSIGEKGVLECENGPVTIYRKVGEGYTGPEEGQYYHHSQKPEDLSRYFTEIVRDLTTKISTEVSMKNDAILRDIMGQGLVLTEGTVITVYRQTGIHHPEEKWVDWNGQLQKLDSLTIVEHTSEKPLTSKYGIYVKNEETGEAEYHPYISVYNLHHENNTDPDAPNYHPHTIDVVGYDYDKWVVNGRDDKNEDSRLVVTITRVEARDDVKWDRAQTTNHDQSGLWLRAVDGKRDLLEAFVQPSTIFVDRAYVLDYGKTFTLGDWYFDSTEKDPAAAIHVDCNIENGMNYFDEKAPITQNGNEEYGNTKYGNVYVKDGKVQYQPTTTQWGSYDQFYIFGKTGQKSVVSQSANRNGTLWSKVVVVPANSIYYEDSFTVTNATGGENPYSGIVYSGAWEIVGNNPDGSLTEDAGSNAEHSENLESVFNGNVHGWTDDLADDKLFTDGSAHGTGLDSQPKDENGRPPMGATATFTFTGTGVDIYTRTNSESGIVLAYVYCNGVLKGAKLMDNLAVSGDYYQVPTISFAFDQYDTYTVTLTAGAAGTAATGQERFVYYLDGIRVYNPLGVVTNEKTEGQSAESGKVTDQIVVEAYGKEINAQYTEVRDIILDYGDFTHGLEETDAEGAVFIDWIRDGQQQPDDVVGTGNKTYHVGTTFQNYGPKNEVYLAQGQAIVLKVDPQNIYYMGMKSLNGLEATVHVSGLGKQSLREITVGHSADLYYEAMPNYDVMPILDNTGSAAYIVIQNASENGALLALTKLRTTNVFGMPKDNGILPVTASDAVQVMSRFEAHMAEPPAPQILPGQPITAESVLAKQTKMANRLFAAVRTWLQEENGGAA